ncbi:MAG: hypothetical protein OEM04_02830 [Flavobacteriaceae bacterium]|nr:hypothetical protein [Flavobacteriaceae bacterium]
MIIKTIFTAFFLFVFLSCDKKETAQIELTETDSIAQGITKVHDPIITLNPKAKKMVENWEEYQKFDEFIEQYKNISTNNALLNAKYLSKLSEQLKDSIRIEKLNTPSVRIRLNVLHNESLRLADMSSINQIAESEIIQENKNILEAFSALNLKINNIISQEKLNKDVDEFIEEIMSSDSDSSIQPIKRDTLNPNQKPL